MKKFIFIARYFILSIYAMANLCIGVAAQTYPNKPITIIVPFPPGGTTDILAREISLRLQARLGVGVIVQNRDGASGTIGSAQVARSVGDGHLLLLTATHHVINPALRDQLPYDTRRDFTPLAMIASAPNVLIVNSNFEGQTVADLIRMAKEKPGSIHFGSSGTGGANHLSGELFKLKTGIELVHVPYRGAAPALNDLIAGVIPVMFDGLAAVAPQLKTGKIRALAVTTRQRAIIAPEIPTLSELGVQDFDVSSWFGLYAPGMLSADVISRLSMEVRSILQSTELKQRFEKLGVTPGVMSQPEFAAYVDEEIKQWAYVVAQAKIQKQK